MLEAKKLNEALAAVSGFVSDRSVYAAYSKVFLSGTKSLELCAANKNGTVIVDTGMEPIGEACVEHSTFAQAVRCIQDGGLDVVIENASLLLKFGTSKMRVPKFEGIPSPMKFEKKTSGSMDRAEWQRKAPSLSFMNDSGELRVAQGVKMTAIGGTMSLVSGTYKGMAGSSLLCEGEINLVVPHDGIAAACSALRFSDEKILHFSTDRGNLVLSSGGVCMKLTTEQGTVFWTKEKFDTLTQDAIIWDAPRHEVLAFLSQSRMFLEKDATAIEFVPTDDGLLMKFDPLDNTGSPIIGGKGSCSSIIPGKFGGEPITISHEHTRNMVMAADDDWKFIRAETKNSSVIAVSSGDFWAAYPGMRRCPTQ